jgi:hypothetical protein
MVVVVVVSAVNVEWGVAKWVSGGGHFVVSRVALLLGWKAFVSCCCCGRGFFRR